MHPAGRRNGQHGTGEPCTTPGLRAETPFAPQDCRPDGEFGHVVGGLDPGDIEGGPEGRPQGVDAFAHRTLGSADPTPWVRNSPNPDCIWRVRNWEVRMDVRSSTKADRSAKRERIRLRAHTPVRVPSPPRVTRPSTFRARCAQHTSVRYAGLSQLEHASRSLVTTPW